MKSRFVFICAAGHSGSTLLDFLLGAHSGGISVGEITQLPKNISLDSVCSCGKHLSRCEFWSHIITEFGNSIATDLWKDPYRLSLGFIKAGNEKDPEHQTRLRMLTRKLSYGTEYAHFRWHAPVPTFLRRTIQQGTENKRDLFQFILDKTGQQFVVDSSKHYLEGISLYQAAPYETKIISLLRDGRAVFNSGISRGLHPKRALSAWARHSSRSALILKKQIPDRALLTVRYETLAINPESELRRISEFLNINFCSKMLEFGTSDSHIANGNRMRFGQTSEIKLDERWRNELSAPMLRFFERHAGQLNRRLGYHD